jgi:hypothetical protein
VKGLPILLLVPLLFPAAVFAAKADKQPDKAVLVQVTTLLDGSTDRARLAARDVAGALSKDRKVVLLFDGEGVLSLKVGRWFGGHSTPIDRIDISMQERQHLAGLLGTTPDGIPDIYGSLLHFFKGRGVKVYASEQALRQQGLWPDRYDRTAEPASAERMRELLRGASDRRSY